jgi:hypothetical protein
MQRPDDILAAVKRGDTPQTWSVLRPVKSYPAVSGCLGATVTFFVAFFLLFCGAFAAVFSRVASSISSRNGVGVDASSPSAFFGSFAPFPLGWLVVSGGVALALVVLVGVLNASRAASLVPSSYFIFTPDGAVQATGPTAITAIDYAAIDFITSHIQVTTTTQRDVRTGAILGRTSSTSVWGELQYRNGQTVRFRPANRFGSAQGIIQRLIYSHQQYQAMVGGGQYPPRSMR